MAKKDKTHKPVARVAEDKVKASELAVAELERRYGAGVVVKLGSRRGIKHPCIPTGIYTVDQHVIQAGGIPRARITEVFGPESSGKTTIVLHAIAEAQAMGEQAFFVDAEHALDINYAAALGVDIDNLLISQPDSGEQALEITEHLIRSGAFGIGVVDSVAALVPQAEIDGEMGDSNVGLHARLMSQAMRKLTGAVAKTNTALVFINQLREKVGVMYGNPEVTTGGRALKFYASLRLEVRRIKTNTEDDEAVSNDTRIKGVKNKVGSPLRETIVPIEFGKGYNKFGSLIEAGVTNGVIDKSGAWYSFAGERLGQGTVNAALALETNDELYNKVYAEILAKDFPKVVAA